MDLLFDSFVCRINVFPSNAPPFQRGFGSILELVFVARHNLWQIRQRQAQVDPCTSDIEMQVPVEIVRGLRKKGIISAGIIVVTPPLLKSAANKTDVFLRKINPHLEILIREQDSASHSNGRVGTQMLFYREILQSTTGAFSHSLNLAKLLFIALHKDPSERRG